jgi:hypothetical protein
MASLLSPARARRTATTLALALPVALTLLQVPSHAATATATHNTQVARTSAPAHPFSDPVWYPLRNKAEMGCANGNPRTKNSGASACNQSGSVKHGYPAIDFLSLRTPGGNLQTDPVYPMGAGIAHIGNTNFNCQSSTTKGNNGNEGNGAWVWIDHGGGIVSRYHHLSKIDVTNGEYVTSTTQLGETGHSGDVCRSNPADVVNYLHVEVRSGGVNGTRVPVGIAPYDHGIGSLFACSGASRQTWPNAIGGPYGVADWNKVTWHEDTPFIPSAGTSCLPATPATAGRPAGFSAVSGDQKVTLKWTAPAAGDGVDSITFGGKIFRPSQNGYSQEAWRSGVSGSATSISLTKAFDGSTLINGRAYKFQVTFHNADGFSQWSKWLTVTPGAVPKRSSGVRTASIGPTSIGFGWFWTSKDANGLPMKRFDLAIRKHTSGGTATWTTSKGPADSHFFRFANLKHKTSYDVRVRGVNTAGAGPWLTRTYKTKP